MKSEAKRLSTGTYNQLATPHYLRLELSIEQKVTVVQ